MAYKRKRRVSGSGTNTALIIGGVALAGIALYMVWQKSQPATTIIKTASPSAATTSAATTAAEITAGAGLATTLANDLLGDDSDS
jgi:hypothetical protein